MGETEKAMKRIPIAAAKRIATEYGYDQVMIYARKVGSESERHGEHMTTYGVNKAHCSAAAKIGNFLKYKIMGWIKENETCA
jgi:acetylornithine/succinyldiaminopimelate/putrescine aminotransferase